MTAKFVNLTAKWIAKFKFMSNYVTAKVLKVTCKIRTAKSEVIFVNGMITLKE